LPTIDLGKDYRGPIPSASLRPSHDVTVIADGEEQIQPGDTERLLEEVVAYEFLGFPPGGFCTMMVRHLDGNTDNCAADNLAWSVIEMDDEDAEFLATIKMMRRHTRKKKTPPPPTKSVRRLYFTSALNVPGMVPIRSSRS
jgi:hypothetical protein